MRGQDHRGSKDTGAFRLADRLARREAGSGGEGEPPGVELPDERVVVIGFGHAGQTLVRTLRSLEIPYVIAEGNARSVEKAREQGYRVTAHCDVDQMDSIKHIWECLDLLKTDRIDHGVNSIESRA